MPPSLLDRRCVSDSCQYCLSIEHPSYALRRRVRWGAAGLGHELAEQSEWEQKKGPHEIWAPKVTLLIEHNQQ